MKIFFAIVVMMLSVDALTLEKVTTTIRSVMAIEGGSVIIYLNDNVHICSHKDRVAIRVTEGDYNNQGLSIALAAKATGEKVTLFLKDGCQEYGQKNIQGIVFGDYAYW